MPVCRADFSGKTLAGFYGGGFAIRVAGVFAARTHSRRVAARTGSREFLSFLKETPMAETPRYAHLITLLFLGSAFLIFVCVIATAVAAISKAGRAAKFAAGGAVLTGLGYFALLFGVALASGDKTLPPGNWKYFCKADCHIAYSIESTQEASTLAGEAQTTT